MNITLRCQGSKREQARDRSAQQDGGRTVAQAVEATRPNAALNVRVFVQWAHGCRCRGSVLVELPKLAPHHLVAPPCSALHVAGELGSTTSLSNSPSSASSATELPPEVDSARGKCLDRHRGAQWMRVRDQGPPLSPRDIISRSTPAGFRSTRPRFKLPVGATVETGTAWGAPARWGAC